MNVAVIKNKYFRCGTPLIIFFAYMLHKHATLNFNGDDIWFQQYGSISAEYFWHRYNEWTSRILTEFLLVNVVNLPIYVWRIADSLFSVSLCAGIAWLISSDEERVRANITAMILFALYPFDNLSGAGWAATTINYLWPATFFIIALIPLKKIILRQNISLTLAIIGLTALTFAEDSELMLMSAGLLLLGVIFKFPFIIRSKFFMGQIIVTAISFAKFVFCPGNHNRYLTEAGNGFQDYMNLTVFDKLNLGISFAGSYFLLYYDYIFIIFSATALYLTWKKSHCKFYRIIAAAPLAIKILSAAIPMLWLGIYHMGPLRRLIGFRHDINIMNYDNILSYVPFVLSVLFFLATALAVYIIFMDDDALYFMMIVFLTGLATIMALSFSPSIFLSSIRIFFPMHLAIIVITARCLLKIKTNILPDALKRI